MFIDRIAEILGKGHEDCWSLKVDRESPEGPK